ncbi:uncharacterized protein LOC121873095 [Homarus americanus]|uniref:uncharacterized protein LOC121873095 n=1 Tax=Homarus americanus TaxID=6706 RepID=UPI001C451558|nr:uncharacterized protein LOC121873095 [Homarus americanus]
MMVRVWVAGVLILMVGRQTSSSDPIGKVTLHLLHLLPTQKAHLSGGFSGREVNGGVEGGLPDSFALTANTNINSSSTSYTHHTPTSPIHYPKTYSDHPSTQPVVPLLNDNTNSSENRVLGSLFELGVSHLERQGIKVKEDVVSRSDTVTRLNDTSSLYPESREGSLSDPGVDIEDKLPLLQFLDGLRMDAWAQLKTMALTYIELLDQEYKTQKVTQKLPLDLIKKVLELGDRVNFLHIVGKKVDPGLVEFLVSHLRPIWSQFERFTTRNNPEGSGSPTFRDIVRGAALKTLHQFVGHVLRVTGNYFTSDELDNYKNELVSIVPIAAEGLDLIMNGVSKSPGYVEGRSMVQRQGYGYGGYSQGYGGYGGDGEISYGGYGAHDDYGTSGYGYGVYLDPYLVLGSIGAAALLCFLAYKVIMTKSTTMTLRRRSNEEYLSFLDSSDVPEVVHSIYSMLEGANDKYRSRRSLSSHLDFTDDLAQSLNSLWWEHEHHYGCVRCLLFNYTVERNHTEDNRLQRLTVAGMAHLLGADRSGQLVDEVTNLTLEGRPVICEQVSNTCNLK